MLYIVNLMHFNLVYPVLMRPGQFRACEITVKPIVFRELREKRLKHQYQLRFT